ncbi:hypothetical protein HELRODRAFT_62537 [Helobdella robusta]|uniref:Uncharacterized protein n=1 Tax=Helobdella robusta TaxID=6412 RepID=T1FX19_HELRO|nr:hypothetical protein HELRODRAFT_62537 [Helobdella robusta]ESO12852.1 hypothetical protein HELRODRAFT_62537 [Helobdella robusta]
MLSNCAGCGSEILDQYIMKVYPDMSWHASCLKCYECNQFLNESSTCFVRQDKTYCKKDYVRLFATRCRLCQAEFKENDLVMRARNHIYHTDCFRCVACHRILSSGEEYCIREKGIYCKVDVISIDKQEEECLGASAKTNYRSARNNISNNNNSSNNRSNNSSNTTRLSTLRTTSHKSDHKATRVRTVLNEKQLHTLRTCYGANPRPDALMKEQLVEMTGLSPRVIRVWFQNKRCKDKKRTQLLKQIQQQQQEKVCHLFLFNYLIGWLVVILDIKTDELINCLL